MRVVSWIVVLASLAWLFWGNANRVNDLAGLIDTPLEEVAGTVLPAPPAITWREVKKLSRRYTQAWNSHDPERIAAQFTPDGRFIVEDGASYAGSASLANMAEEFLSELPDLKMHMTRLERDGDRVLYHWTISGTHAATGATVELTGVESWLLAQDGRIQESRETWDEADYRAQVGGG